VNQNGPTACRHAPRCQRGEPMLKTFTAQLSGIPTPATVAGSPCSSRPAWQRSAPAYCRGVWREAPGRSARSRRGARSRVLLDELVDLTRRGESGHRPRTYESAPTRARRSLVTHRSTNPGLAEGQEARAR